MFKIEMRRVTLKQTMKKLRRLGKEEYHKIEIETLKAMAAVFEAEVRANISLRDHTLADLRRLDHPYAKRHASIKLHQGLPPKIHIQNGDLVKSLSTEMRRGRGGLGGSHAVARVGFIDNPPEYAGDVLFGTEKMHGRQVLEWTALESKTKRKMFRAAVNVLGPRFRTQAKMKF